VHELNAQLVAAHEALWEFRGEDPALLTPEERLARLSGGAALTGRYAFLTRDLFTLLRTDPVFSAEYRTVRTRRIATFTRLAHHWRSLGTMRALDDAEIADLVEAIWILSETWLPFSELDGSIPDVDHGTRLLRAVLRPHFIVG